MAVANFDELCKGFCEVAGLSPPAVKPDERGVSAFTITWHGIAVTVMHCSANAPETAFVLVEYGMVPADRALSAWHVLLDANLLMLAEEAPVFGRNPDNGEVVSKLACPLARTTAVELYQRVVKMVEAARNWRQDAFLNTHAALDGPCPQNMPVGMFA